MIPEASLQNDYFVPPLSAANLAPNDPALILSLFWEQQAIAVGPAPALFDVTQSSRKASQPAYLSGGCWIEIEPRDNDVFVMFSSVNGPALCTPNSGRRIRASTASYLVPLSERKFWLPGNTFQFMDIVSPSGSLVVFRRCSGARIAGLSVSGVPTP